KGRSDRTSGPHLLRISKQLEVPVSTVAHISQKFKTHGTVLNCVQRSGLHGRQPRRTPLLKGNHQKARLEFTKMRLSSVWGCFAASATGGLEVVKVK
uniref:Transposase Tc1-like domain-containing protein n=1 Tax=Oryzias sinensis TaxID=183150 RepID=A0A8C8DU80_9TELE